MARTFTVGDPDPGDVNTVHTASGTAFHRNKNGGWCNESHADDPHVYVLNPNHRGASWDFMTERLGPIIATD